jgi:hypothetical protein
MVLTHQLFVPKDVPEEPGKLDLETLKKAVELASRDDFKVKRDKFHKWKDGIIKDGTIPDYKAVEEMEKYLEKYYEVAKKAQIEVYWKYSFMAIPVALGVGTAGLGAPLVVAGATGLVAIAAFAKFDRKPKNRRKRL